MPTPLLYETHMHTPLCKHAQGDIADYAAVAAQHNLAGITVTCHNPLPGDFDIGVRMAEAQFPQYLHMVADARAACAGREDHAVDVRLGLECDYYPQFEDHLRAQTQSAAFDYLLGSVHAHLRPWRDQFDPGREHGRATDPDALTAVYCDQLAAAAACGLFDCLAHPEVLLTKRCVPPEYDPRRFLDAIAEVLPRIAATGIAMELNTSAALATVRGRAYLPDLLTLYREHNLPVVLGSDAHKPARVADLWPDALDMLERAGCTHVSFFIERRRRDVPLDHARASLTPAAPDGGTGVPPVATVNVQHEPRT
jgi:histidinol-phosphatase (PHP family)